MIAAVLSRERTFACHSADRCAPWRSAPACAGKSHKGPRVARRVPGLVAACRPSASAVLRPDLATLARTFALALYARDRDDRRGARFLRRVAPQRLDAVGMHLTRQRP